MAEDSTRILTAHGVPITVRIVRRGDGYGAGHALVHGNDDPMVEFYDARFDDERFDKGYGQFVSRYDADVLMETDGSSPDGRPAGKGLLLDTGSPEWRIDGKAMDGIVEWLDRNLDPAPAPGI